MKTKPRVLILALLALTVHAFKSLLLKNTGFEAIGSDLLSLCAFSVVAMTLATRLFKRTL